MLSIRRALMSGLALLPSPAAGAAPLGRRTLPRWTLLSTHTDSALLLPLRRALSGRFPARWASTSADAVPADAAPGQPTPLDAASATIHETDGQTLQKDPEPLILEDDAHPLRDGAISRPCWTVLSRLRAAGHEAFLVGGTVRDILMGRRPKDYDVLTSADPDQAAALFARAYVLGRSFPIVHVHHDGEIIEVSSFSTGADPSLLPPDAAALARGRDHRREARRAARRAERDRGKRGVKKGRREERGSDDDVAAVTSLADSLLSLDGNGSADASSFSEDINSGGGSSSGGGEGWGVAPAPAGPTWAAARRDNARKRDFTVNGLLYDPFGRILYDYVGGVADCGARVLRTLSLPEDSLSEDPARILRAVRLAARAGLTIDASTAVAMARLAPLTAVLPHGRLQMELAAVMAHGAAAPSVALLWRFGLLDTVVPLLAALLAAERVPREPLAGGAAAATVARRDAPGTALMLAILGEMDAQAGVDRPLDSAVWVTALAAPLVAAECRRAAKRRRARQRRSAGSDESGSQITDNSVDEMVESGEGELWEAESSEDVGGAGQCGGDSAGHEEEGEGVREGSGDVTVTSEYLEAYSKVVDKVLGRLLAPPDAKTRRALANAPRPPLADEASGGDVNSGNVEEDAGGEGLSGLGTASPSVACLLPRQAVESARELFLLEAELRGHDLPVPEEGRPKRAARRSTAATTRRLRRRRLNATEHLALQLLRAPGVGWAAATAL